MLHLIAISAMAAWTASPHTLRPRFAGENAAIELVVTRSEPTWSPESVTFDRDVFDEVRVTVEPSKAMIARKQFELAIATEAAFTAPELTSSKFDLAARPQADAPTSSPEIQPQQLASLPRQELEPREPRATIVQLPRALGTDRTAPSFTSSPPPTYPSVAIENNWEGTVLLRVYINAEGSIDDVEVARSSGYPVLDGAAVNAVQRWSGSPATEAGRQVATVELLPVRFKLRD
ncbi:MAG TPA: energy transducer TonB [Pirellulaceae bacterium]|nr:energy transducer TonB [Planctomycetales bacterium]MCB9939115.1 energy transducer TonB [Planctomycetaceae bacterium]HRX80850.1 energy transducer TonB [Pirellulaceae bacterium]